MACKCNVCVGTGKCRTCKGTGEVESNERQNFRAARRDRLYFPGPRVCGIWRYWTLAVAKVPIKPRTGGGKLAKDDSVPTNPDCAEEKIWPCSAEDWRPCAKCGKLVCERHDYLVPVWPPEDGACEPADLVCRDCIELLWYRGDISQGIRMRYLC